MLFKPDTKGQATALQPYIKISQATDFNSFAPFINRVERDYLIPLIGKELYNRLNTWYNLPVPVVTDPPVVVTPTADDIALGALLPICQEPIANIAYLLAFNIISIKTSDSGIKRIETDTEKPLFQYQEVAIKTDLKNAGFNALDNLLAFLELDSVSLTVSYPEWAGYSTLHKKYFLNSTKEFNSFYPIDNSRLVYKRLCYYIEAVQSFKIAPAISKAYFDDLLGQIISNSIKAVNMPVVEYLKKAIAYYTISMATKMLGIDITDKGFYYSELVSSASNYKTETQAKPDNLKRIEEETEEIANQYLLTAIDYMTMNVADFPVFQANILSKNYSREWRFENTDKKVIAF